MEEYDEIRRRIIDFDFDDEEEEEEDNENNMFLNSENKNEDEKFDNITLINGDKFDKKNDNYNYISYIIDRNKYYKKIEESNKEKLKKEQKEENDSLRGQNKKIKIVKDSKYNLLSSNVKLFYLELDISRSNDFKKI